MGMPVSRIPLGNDAVDILLHHLIAVFELVFPARIRGYYLTGSSVDGSAAYLPDDPLNSSDIDLLVLFKGAVQPYEQERFMDCRTACAGLSHLYVDHIDATAVSETVVMQHGHLALQRGSHHLYGEDIRHLLPDPSLHDHIAAAIRMSKWHLAVLRRLAPGQLVSPLTYPDITGAFFGYDYLEARYSAQAGTRILIGSITWAATALVAIHAGQLAPSKQDAVRMYRTYINDSWSWLIEAVYGQCKLRWGHLIPDAKAERKQLRAICEQIIGFENDCLSRYIGYES